MCCWWCQRRASHLGGCSVALAVNGLAERGLITEGIKQPVEEHKELAVVVDKMRVVDQVVGAAHDWFRVAGEGVVDVGGPDGGEEQQGLLRDKIDRHDEHRNEVWRCLKNSVEWMKSQSSEGRKCVDGVVQVMVLVQPAVQKFDFMEA